ncbi:MAG: putative rane protein [Acidobacteriaceae bacterium]|nr:putative rane protein [Acidobacteriaceae bacterium]
MLSAMKYPVVITVSRVVELVASVVIMFYLVSEFGHDVMKVRFTMRLYFWVGFASAVYSIVCYPLDILGIASLGTYSDLHRMRGFMNEGGPYGLYILSVLLVGVALYRQGWEPTRRLGLSMAVIGIAFLKSESKAALAVALFLFLLNGLMARSTGRRGIVIGATILFLAISSQFVDLARGIRIYREAGATYERVSHLHKQDTSFVAGWVAGAFLVPRMIAAHPWSGIGWGNYATIRNAPEYRGAAAWANLADDPGLGILGTVAELGILLGAYLMVCLIFPYLYLRRLGMPLYVTNLALLQPVVHIFGAQLNMTYPWIVTAFALGLACVLAKKIRRDELSKVAG